MEKRSREKIALAMFLVLVALGGVLLGGYFLTGRSWSVAATMVDDTVGSLDRYTVVAFSGTIPLQEESKDRSQASPSSSSNAASSSSAASSTDSESVSAEIGPEFTMQDAFGEGSGASSDLTVKEAIQSIFQRQDRRKAALDDNVYVSDVRDLYDLKGASGITLNVSDSSIYAEPIVMSAGEKKIGVFSISAYASRAKLKAIAGLLDEQGADTVICIAPRSSMLAMLDGIDVVICTKPAGASSERESPSTLVVESPEIGDVGVVLLSSNNVPSFKVVKEL